MEQKTEASQAVDELLPCPFCGGPAHIDEQEPHSHTGPLAGFMPDYPGSFTVECMGAGCNTGQIADTRAGAVAMWNRRAVLKAQPAPTEAAEQVHAPAERMAECNAFLATLPAQDEDSARLDAERDVLAERRRQVEKEGWTPEHDDMHDDGQMAVAAGFYALQCGYPHERTHWRHGEAPMYWPWAASWWKPTTKRVNLVKAGALILAEIERIDRARASAEKDETGGAV